MHPPIFRLRNLDPGPVAAWFGLLLSIAILAWVAAVEIRECSRVAAEPPPMTVDSYYEDGR